MIEFSPISGSQLKLSRLILGQWNINQLDNQSLDALIKTALEVGITTFDHADIYGDYTCERSFGKWFRNHAQSRQSIQLISKCGIKLLSQARPRHQVKHYDTSKSHIISSVENSLKGLHTDYLDLLLIHRPDPLMQPEEVAAAFDELHQAGKVLHFGVSNFTSLQFELLQKHTRQPLVTNQIEASLFNNTPFLDGSIDYLMTKGVNPMAWSPLGGRHNVLSLLNNDAIQSMAERYETSVPNLLLTWLLKHPSYIFPVIGTMNPERLRNAVQALSVDIDREDWFILLETVRGYAVA